MKGVNAMIGRVAAVCATAAAVAALLAAATCGPGAGGRRRTLKYAASVGRVPWATPRRTAAATGAGGRRGATSARASRRCARFVKPVGLHVHDGPDLDKAASVAAATAV